MLTAPPTDGAFTNDIVTEAVALLDGVDLVGSGYSPDRGDPERRRQLITPIA